MFKKHKAYKISDSFKVSKKKVREELTSPSVDMGDTFNTNIENVDVMEEWVERRLIIKAEHKIMNRRYLKGRLWHDLGIIVLASLIVTIGFDYFVSSTGATGIFPFGLGAFARFFAILLSQGHDPLQAAKIQSSYYFIFYLAINAPLIIFGFWKIGTKFSFLTMFAMAVQIAWDQILQAIPGIRPNDFAMLINSKEIGTIPTAWNGAVWLFIKAFIGGIILGIGYGLPYTVGGSNGGADFPAMYISIRYKKNISKVNKIIYFLTFFTALILNTVILDPGMFNPDIKYGELFGSSNAQLWDGINKWLATDTNYAGQISDDVAKKLQEIGSHLKDSNFGDIIDKLSNNKNINGLNSYDYKEGIRSLAQSSFGIFPSKMVSEMRFLFIFGPSLFASLLMIYMSTTFTNIVYPTHTIKSYILSTSKKEEIKNALTNLGYRNEIIEWNANTILQGKELDKDALMVTMSVSNWKEIRDDLLEVDPKMNVNILKTDKVRGKFDYEIRSDRELRYAWEILKQDDEWLKEIHEQAIQVTKKQHEKYMSARQKTIDKFTYKDVPNIEDIKTQKELKYWKTVAEATAKQSKNRALLNLKNDWLSEWSESWAQYDYIKSEHRKDMKAIKKPSKEKVKTTKHEYEVALKKLNSKSK